MILDLMVQSQEIIGEENAGAVSVVGESYGGFLATVVAALDSKSKHLINGSVVSFGPPLHRNAVLEHLDEGLEEMKSTHFGAFAWKKHFCLLDLLFPNSYFSGMIDSQQTSRSIFYLEFQKYLSDSAKHIHEQDKVQNSFKEDLKFNEFLQIYAPENLTRLGSRNFLSVTGWLREMSEDYRQKVLYFSSSDDILNVKVREKYSWKKVAQLVGEDNLILLNGGGHLGYLEYPEMNTILDEVFNIFRQNSPSSG